MVQLSDIRAEAGGMFRPDLMERVVEETNEEAPDLVAVAGDLIGAGYREQFEMAKGYSTAWIARRPKILVRRSP